MAYKKRSCSQAVFSTSHCLPIRLVGARRAAGNPDHNGRNHVAINGRRCSATATAAAVAALRSAVVLTQRLKAAGRDDGIVIVVVVVVVGRNFSD